MHRFVSLLCLSLLAGPGLGRAPRAADLDWTEVETAHLRLYSSVRDAKTREVAEGLGLLRDTLEALFPRMGMETASEHPERSASPEDRPTVFLFEDQRAYRPYGRVLGPEDERIRGHLVAHPLGDFVVLDAYPPEGASSLPVAYHEMTHAFLESRYPAVPSWLHEGLAEYFSTFQALGDEVQVGVPHAEHVRSLRRRRFTPWEEILSTGEAPRGNGAESFYAQSWLLVHFLRHREDGAAGDLQRYLEALAAEQDPGEAFRRTFGLDPSSLETPLRRYLHRSRFEMTDISRERLPTPSRIAIRPAPPGEVLYRLGLLLTSTGDAEDAASDHFREAIRRGDPDARAGLGHLLEERDPAAAEREYRAAIASGPDDPLTFHLYGRWLVRRLRGEVPGPTPELATVRRVLERGLELDPGEPRLRSLLGTTWLFDDGPFDEGIRYLRAARRARPGHPATLFNLAMLYRKAGRLEEAENLAEGPLAAADPELAERATRELRRKRLELRVNEALRNRRPEEARRLVREAGTRGAELRSGELDRWLERIDVQARHQREAAIYNEAVTYANFGEWGEVVEILRPLVEEGTVPEVVAAARKLLAEAEHKDD